MVAPNVAAIHQIRELRTSDVKIATSPFPNIFNMNHTIVRISVVLWCVAVVTGWMVAMFVA